MADGLQEYVIKLSTQIDNPGVSQLFSILDSNKMKALGLTAALAGVTTAVYKFISSAAQEEIELNKLAKQQKKNVEQTRAEQEALKSMGKTLEEINKDKNLKAIYDDLVKFNKEMALPNTNQTVEKVQKLQSAFSKLKTTVNYALKWIGHQVLVNLEQPMDRISNKMDSATKWIRDNMPMISSKIGVFISDFAKGVIGIAEGVGKIFEWIGRLPEGIKAVGAAIGAVIALIKGGPIGQILALVTAVGDVIHDYEVYQWDKSRGLKPGDEGYVRNLNDTLGIWDIFDDPEKTIRDKAKDFSRIITEGINDGLESFINTLNNGEGITEWIEKLTGPVGQIFSGIADYFSGDGASTAATLISNVITAGASLLAKGGKLGAQLVGAVASIFTSDELWKGSDVEQMFSGNNGLVNAVFSGIETALVTGNVLGGVIGGVISLYQTEREKALRKIARDKRGQAEADRMSYTDIEKAFGSDPELMSLMLGDLSTDFNGMVTGLAQMLIGGISFAGDVAGDLLTAILKGLFTAIGGKDEAENTALAALNEIGRDNVIWDGLATGIGLWIASGDFLTGIIGGVTTAITKASQSESGDVWAELEKAAGEFVDMFNVIWLGAIDKQTGEHNGKGLKSLIIKAWEGDGDNGGLKSLFEKLGEDIAGWLSPIGDAIRGFFESMWTDIYNAMPNEIKTVFGLIGGENPNSSVVKRNDDGTYTVTSTNNETYTTRPMGEEEGKLLEGMAPYIAVSGGKLVGSKQLTGKYAPLDYGNGNTDWTKFSIDNYLEDWMAGKKTSYLFRIGNAQGVTMDLIQSIVERFGGEKAKGIFGTSETEETQPETAEAPAKTAEEAPKEPEGQKYLIYTKEDAQKTSGVTINAETVQVAGDTVEEPAQEAVMTEAPAPTPPTLYVAPKGPEGEDLATGLAAGGAGAKEKPKYDADFVHEFNFGGNHHRITGEDWSTLQTWDNEENTWLNRSKSTQEDFKDSYESGDFSFDDLQSSSDDTASGLAKTTVAAEAAGSGMDKASDSASDLASEAGAAADALSLTAGAISGISEAATAVTDALTGAADKINNLSFKSGGGGDGDGGGEGGGDAFGGRYSRQRLTTVAEGDQTEYIIPISKPDRAVSLIRQMLSEMGSAAVHRVISGLGLGEAGTLGYSMGTMGSALSGMSMNNVYNISAPVNINVNASGASAEDIGKSAYNAAERHLVKTLTGVNG